ncbi:Hsp70 family protein [uncultured Tateyamaria sp.]|uniref:Hsp70 family protein n=1 Tax=uncultured Tateyamaria sp. TaxID=455651 RepID=UPI00262F39B9|nr:Hsp70 family protein [uncultured Tateyamaria sp.]
MAQVLGIDFGTSNSAAGYVRDGKPHLVTMAPGQTTLPTAVFFDYDARKMLMGHPANAALLDGIEGRFMRALKRVLGTSIMHEKRQLLNTRMTFVDIIGRFLAEVKKRAEAEAGHSFDHALSGRPVVFHGTDDPREAQAEADLRACYLAAGFKDVTFLPEPEAAAIASGALDHPGATGLIVDIGGGTSDFSVFRTGNDGVTILANHGVRIGGTDFDRSISIDRVMPHFGAGTLIRNAIGPGTLPAPKAIFNDLATWEKIPFLYTAKTRRMARDLAQLSEEPGKMGRLETVLENELGHDVAFAVEQGKIDANSGREDAEIALDEVARGLSAAVPASALRDILEPHAAALRKGVAEALEMAGVDADGIDQVIYVGGSGLMSMVTDTMGDLFPAAKHSFSEVFTAVADGLAIAASR